MVLGMAPEAPLRAAATVLVVRDGAMGPEIFMVRRHDRAAFMGGAYVFPGGGVDVTDRDEVDIAWCDGLDAVRCRLEPLPPVDCVAHHVAAARELFEEAGVLLARDQSGRPLSLANPADHDRFLRHRHEVHAGRRTLRDVLVAERVRLALDELIAFAHWVTPPLDTRRFDTWFFVAVLPPGQAPVLDEIEHTDGRWMRPSDAVRRARHGEIVLPIPTWSVLRELEGREAVVDIVRLARQTRIVRREPKLVQANGSRLFVLPGDPLYPESGEEPVRFETRFVWDGEQWRAVAGDGQGVDR
jgi:8-oxo-dGTP pyrophosphatase MutT (NUDIX family)